MKASASEALKERKRRILKIPGTAFGSPGVSVDPSVDPWVIEVPEGEQFSIAHVSPEALSLSLPPTFSESKAHTQQKTRSFELAVLWVRQEYGENPVAMRAILEDSSIDVETRAAAGLVLTELVQEQAAKITRKTRTFGHHAAST